MDEIDYSKTAIFIPDDNTLSFKVIDKLNMVLGYDKINQGWYVSSNDDYKKIKKMGITINDIIDLK